MNRIGAAVLIGIGLIVLAVCAIFFVYPYAQNVVALSGQAGWDNADRAYQWIVSAQRKNRQFGIFHNGLLPSHEDGDVAFVYDEALAAMAFTLREDLNTPSIYSLKSVLYLLF